VSEAFAARRGDNPFERYDIDPQQGATAITERMRELMAEAASDEERDALRAAWEELTMHPRRRLEVALAAFPETRPPVGSPPPRKRTGADRFRPTLRDLAWLPSLLGALGEPPPRPLEPFPPFDEDPLLRDP